MNREGIAGLDAWRAALMLGGVFLHAVPEGADRLLFQVVAYLSSHFRMGAFMMISGLLLGLTAGRRQAGPWLRSRAVALALPLLTGLVLTVPVMAALRMHYDVQPPGHATLWFNAYHLWFLIALIAYLPLAAWLAFGNGGAALSRHLLAGTASATRIRWRFVLATGGSAFVLLSAGLLLVGSSPPGQHMLIDYLPNLLCYAPLYVVGIVLGLDARLRRIVLDGWRMAFGLIAALIALDFAAAPLPTGLRVLVEIAALAFLPAVGGMLVLASALSIRRVPPWARRLSEASLTLYLLHFPCIKLLQALFDGTSADPYVIYLLVVVATYLLSLALHFGLIARSPLLLRMFNGKRVRPADRTATLPPFATASLAHDR